MPLTKAHFKPLRIVVIGVVLFGGLGIALFNINALKHHNARTSERSKVRAPLIQGCAPTGADLRSGVAVFYVPGGRSAPYSLGRDLPIKAEIVKSLGSDWPTGTQVSLVQAEISDGQHVTLGVIHRDKQLVCNLEDVKLLE